ncbi:hypothetical protein BDF22DRAFT_687782 [Syncephalis plumigaleata]|nr:hypothetical protein BDF22DRAFT_687782 [Syncephalis plumigaleata]
MSTYCAMIVGELSPIAPLVNSGLAALLVGIGATGLLLGFVGYHNERGPSENVRINEHNGVVHSPNTTTTRDHSIAIEAIRHRNKVFRIIALGHLLLYAILLGVGVYALYYLQGIEQQLDASWTSEYSLHPDTLQALEEKLHCCGYRSLYDRAVPAHCAALMNRLHSCQGQVYARWHESLYAIIIISLGVFALETLGLLVLMAIQLRRKWNSRLGSNEPLLARTSASDQRVIHYQTLD